MKVKQKIHQAVVVFLAMVIISGVAWAQEAVLKPNELRTGWGAMFGYARCIAPIGQQAALWVSYDVFRAQLAYYDIERLKGKGVLASIRTEPLGGRGLFLEAGAGWGKWVKGKTPPTYPAQSESATETIYAHPVVDDTGQANAGLGWQAAFGYRFSPSFRMDVKVVGVEADSLGPWLTLAFNF